MTSHRPAVILDCDPGHDDAIAILVAARHSELLGITTVSGNVALELTTRNALITAQLSGLSTPVHAGATRPLVAPTRHAEFIHGDTGLNGPRLPPLTRRPADDDAVRFIIETARAQDGVWLIATGPLTNVAMALRSAPDLVERLQGISIMGGSSSFGNITPTAEFNIYADPEAAAVVFGSGARLVMAGLDLTHQFMIDSSAIGRIRELGSVASDFTADLLTFYVTAYAEVSSGQTAGPLHDPCAVLAITHPHLFTSTPRHVAVELTGTHTRGMTVVDTRQVRHQEAANATVLEHIDEQAALELLLATIASYS